jgi:hypothetical protein
MILMISLHPPLLHQNKRRLFHTFCCRPSGYGVRRPPVDMSHLSPRPHVPSYATCKTLIAFCLEAIQSSWWSYSLFQNTQHSTLPRSCLTTMRVPTVLCKNEASTRHLSVCISSCISVRSHVCGCSATYPALQEHCCKPPVGNNSENEISTCSNYSSSRSLIRAANLVARQEAAYVLVLLVKS